MTTPRKHWFSQRFEVKNIGGELVTMYVVSDLSNKDLARQMAFYIEREDFEYCEVLKAEADLRGIIISSKKEFK